MGISALSGAGMDDFFEAVKGATAEYREFYLPDLERMQAVSGMTSDLTCSLRSFAFLVWPPLCGITMLCGWLDFIHFQYCGRRLLQYRASPSTATALTRLRDEL